MRFFYNMFVVPDVLRQMSRFVDLMEIHIKTSAIWCPKTATYRVLSKSQKNTMAHVNGNVPWSAWKYIDQVCQSTKFWINKKKSQKVVLKPYLQYSLWHWRKYILEWMYDESWSLWGRFGDKSALCWRMWQNWHHQVLVHPFSGTIIATFWKIKINLKSLKLKILEIFYGIRKAKENKKVIP